MTRSLVPAVILLALLAACGRSAAMHINREYRMPAAMDSVIALFPTDFHLQSTDDSFQSSFARLTSFKQVIPPGDVRKRQRIGSQVHAALRQGSGTAPLKVLLSETQYSYLVTSLAPANQLSWRNSKQCRPGGSCSSAPASRSSSRRNVPGSCHSTGPSFGERTSGAIRP